LSNHYLFQIITNLDSQQMVTLSLKYICTIPFQTRASDVKMLKFRQYSSNRRMPCFVNVLSTFRGTWDQPDKNPGLLFWCAADIFLNINNCEIQWSGMLIPQETSQASLVRCTFAWHNRHSGGMFILCIPPPIAPVHLSVDWTTLRVSAAHQSKIKVHLQWEMCQKELDTFENVPTV
jgi:hypothetical protein